MVLVRRFRPLFINVGLFLCITHRLVHLNGPSLLESLMVRWASMNNYISDFIQFYGSNGNGYIVSDHVQTLVLALVKIISIIGQDVVATTGVMGILRFVYCIFHFRSSEWKDQLSYEIFQWLIHSEHLPFVSTKVQHISDEILKEANSMLKKDPNRLIRASLPKVGVSDDIILSELRSCANRENEKCQSGKISGTLYSGGQKHSELMSNVYSLYQWSNPLKPGVWPRINQCEAEIVAMASGFLHGPRIGSVTSGGTESIISAVRAHLICYGKRRGISSPEIICGSTAHCSLNKACSMLGIRLVCIDCDDGHSYELKAKHVKKYITCNTVMIFSSAPNFPQGTVDPIEDLSKLAMQYDIGLHVDACLGED